MSHSLVQQNGASNGFTHSAVCLTKGPQLLPKRVLHTVRSNVFSFGFQNPRVSLTASSSCLRLLPRLPVTSILPWQWKIPKDATVYQNFIIPYFKWSSTCFGRHTAHHQEPKTAQAVSGFAHVEGCRILPSIFPSVTCFRRQFLRKLWPIQLDFLPFTACTIFISFLTLCNTSSFLTRSF